MRPYIPVDIIMRESSDLQKSIATDLSIPDPTPSNIITPEPQKSTGRVENSESTPQHDTGTSSINDNISVRSSSE
jgi:hypothetical protein